MSKESFYFSHDYEPTADPKILAMLGEYKSSGYGLYWRIIEMMHSEDSHKLPLKKYIYLGISQQMSTDVEQVVSFVDSCIKDFELFKTDGDFFWSERVFRNIQTRQGISEKRSLAGKESARKRAEKSTNGQQVSTSVEQNPTKESKGKEIKGNENKENIKTSFDTEQEKFKELLRPFVDTYGREMMIKFYDYWREPNKSKTKMRWQQEKTWDLKLRLKRWADNQKIKPLNNSDEQQSGPPLKRLG